MIKITPTEARLILAVIDRVTIEGITAIKELNSLIDKLEKGILDGQEPIRNGARSQFEQDDKR